MVMSQSASSFCLFATDLGTVGIVWNDRGLVRFQLPNSSVDATRDRLLSSHPEAREGTPKASWLRELVSKTQRHFQGESQDFRHVPLDLGTISDFYRSVYQATREIRPGEVRTYGEIAREIGRDGGARAVGQALGRNPVPLVIPCHRVLASGGRGGGFSAYGGLRTKDRLLRLEGFAGPSMLGANSAEVSPAGE